MELPKDFDFKNQPKLDSDTTKGRFKGQVVIVTGGSGGIGSAFVQRFANDGAKVALIDLNEPKFDLENVKFFKCDVSKREHYS